MTPKTLQNRTNVLISIQSKCVLFCFTSILLSCNTTTCKTHNTTERKNVTHTIRIEKPLRNDITKTLVLGKFNYREDSTFVKVNLKHAFKTVYLKKEVYNAFIRMHNAAEQDGIRLKIISGTRNFNEQKKIWEHKWKTHKALQPKNGVKKILEFSAMPSTSRHHWGTDIDINNLNNLYFNSGKGKKEYEWLVNNANAFGFYQVYNTKTNGRTGYNLEQWHWSYLPLASSYLAFYNKSITNDDINGFLGSNLAEELNIISDYVNGISKKAKAYN